MDPSDCTPPTPLCVKWPARVIAADELRINVPLTEISADPAFVVFRLLLKVTFAAVIDIPEEVFKLTALLNVVIPVPLT